MEDAEVLKQTRQTKKTAQAAGGIVKIKIS